MTDHAAILDLALDNDGLWEFTYIGGERHRDPHSGIERVSANPDAFRDLHQSMIDLLRAGYITIRSGSGEDLDTDEAVAVLSDASNWALPSPAPGSWEAENEAYRVALTARGESARTG